MVYDTARKIFIFLNFILSISSILTMHKCFPWPEGCEGIFKNQKFNIKYKKFHLAVFSI